MIRSRTGWKVVTLIVVFLILRSIGATIVELRFVSGGLTATRLICLAGWIAIVVCLGFGMEWARFAAVMLLALGSAFSVAVLLDPPLLQERVLESELPLLQADLLVFIASNLVVIPLLAFFKPVRSFFAKVPNTRFR
jgi:hypothetical protein